MAEPPTTSPRAGYLLALTAEIRILIRAVAGDTQQDISKLQVAWIDAEQKPTTLNYPQVVVALAQDVPSTDGELLIRIGRLQAIRDALVRLTKPATGLSIAYTSLVSGNQRGKGSDSTYELAQMAFGGLGWSARIHRLSITAFCAIAVLLAGFASWEATKASLGKSLLQVLEPLRTQQSALATEKFKLEMALDKEPPLAGANADLRHLPVCDRYLLSPGIQGASGDNGDRLAVIATHASPEIRDLCGRDLILSRNFGLAHAGLRKYQVFWPDLVGGLYGPSAHLIDRIIPSFRISPALADTRPDEPPTSLADRPGSHMPAVDRTGDDVEFWVAPIVQVITSFILPFIFGIIGSLLYVILQHYNDVRTNLLLPRDLALSYLRVILGVVVAVCVSLLITGSAGPAAPIQPSASGSTAPGSLVGSLTLSASLITFLAGFGAEAVFTLLQTLVQRVFAAPTST